ncbi:MAG: RIP metalloprotease RseP [Pseudomonadota bacterium]|nr:MAG: RIP metalloprotease RseP [Pseudomonadota bacterium]
MDFFGPVIWLIVALGVLITFHEFGHFWVARRCGVRVLRFSIGFGPPLYSRTGRSGTEFRIAAFPLGGYVKMLDEHEGPVPAAEQHAAFNRKPVGQRMAIVAAGPAFNLIFAVLAFWLMFVIGVPETRPVIGTTEGLAAEAGLSRDDLIVRIGERRTQTWTHALLGLIPPALDREPVDIVVEQLDGRRRTVTLELDRLGPTFSEERALSAIGLQPWRPELPPEIGEITTGSAAEVAGLRPGDRIVSIAGQAVTDWDDVADLIPQYGLSEDGSLRPLELRLVRDGAERIVEITPRLDEGRPIIGIRPPPPDPALQEQMARAFTVLRHDPATALGEAVSETGRLTAATFGILGRMLTGKASLNNLSGPITIAQMAHSSAVLGFSRFLFFLGLISLSLAIINLLPIPLLDGGHLMYYLVEIIKGSPVSERTLMAGQYVGILLVAGLMGLALFNDLLRLFT